MGGSQLKQLKAAINTSGLQDSRGKKRKRGGYQNGNAPGSGSILEHRDKRAQKLDEIQKKFNTFDIKVEKLKNDVGGRKLKGTMGRPGVSKQVAIERRKNTLLVEYESKDKVGGLVDRRFGENDPTLSLEEKMLARFTKERQRASKGVVYNLEDQDELTHFGQSLSRMDDFDDAGLTLDDDEEENAGQIDAATVKAAHFGGFSDDEANDDDGPPRKKSKAEVMAEVIAKSKEHKYARQLQLEQDESTRHALDDEFDAIRGILFSKPPEKPLPTFLSGSNSLTLATNPSSKPTGQNPDREYDTFVRELATDKKSQPKDRTKTEEEVALEEKEALEVAEKRRLRRMMGEREDSDEDEDEDNKSKKRKSKGGDDLDDDFMLDEDEEQTELRYMLGSGLQEAPLESVAEDEDEDMNGSEEESSDEDEDEDEDEDGEDEDDEDENEFGPSDEGEEAEEGDLEELIDTRHIKGRASSKLKPNPKSKSKKQKEIPFTFPCPSSHAEFLDTIEDIDDEMIGTVVERIRKLHHPSLHVDNKSKLQALIGVLLDHTIYCASQSPPRLSVVDDIYPHIYTLSKAYPIESAEHFISKLNLLQKNLTRGLQDPLDPASKTFPDLPELTVLRITGLVWSTSDLQHAVVSPARILMGAYLGLGRVRSLKDIVSGLFLCSIFMQYGKLSQRFIPEAINFIVQSILLLAPSSYTVPDSVPGYFPIPDFESEHLPRSLLRFKLKRAGQITPQPPSLSKLLSEAGQEYGEQSKLDLLALSMELLRGFAEIYKALDGFIELYEPILAILRSIALSKLPSSIHKRISEYIDTFSRLLKFAHQARKPLLLQAHKPIPIASFVPKFEAHHSSYMRTKHKDPDADRAELAKLKALHRKEKKGAMRELRKDNRFLADVQREKQEAKDREYKARMVKAFAGLESERTEQRKEEKEKRNEKRRANRK